MQKHTSRKLGTRLWDSSLRLRVLAQCDRIGLLFWQWCFTSEPVEPLPFISAGVPTAVGSPSTRGSKVSRIMCYAHAFAVMAFQQQSPPTVSSHNSITKWLRKKWGTVVLKVGILSRHLFSPLSRCVPSLPRACPAAISYRVFLSLLGKGPQLG